VVKWTARLSTLRQAEDGINSAETKRKATAELAAAKA
jgi:hypothetical protein